MTSEWMADAQMREWANQSLPRSRDRDGEPPELLLEQAKQLFLSLSPEQREEFLRWLVAGAPPTLLQ